MGDRTARAWYARSFMLMAGVWLGVFKEEHGAKQAQSALFLETENRWLGSYSKLAACHPCHFARRGGIRKGLKQEGSCNLRLQHLSLSSHMLHFKVFSKRSWPFTSAPRSDVVWAAKQHLQEAVERRALEEVVSQVGEVRMLHVTSSVCSASCTVGLWDAGKPLMLPPVLDWSFPDQPKVPLDSQAGGPMLHGVQCCRFCVFVDQCSRPCSTPS